MHKSPNLSLSRIIIFIGILSVFLFVAGWVVYEACASMFGIMAAGQMEALGWSIGILTASMVASTVIGMRYYNVVTRLYSLISSIWIGLFVYLFFVSVAYGILILVVPPEISAPLGQLCIAFAVVVSMYGIIHARKIHVVEVSVALANLPAGWIGRRAVWVSDLHLGQIRGPAFARRVAEKIKSVQHDIVFIGGDLYDGTGAPDASQLIAPFKGLPSPLGVYFITGNHEEFGNSEKFVAAVTGAGMIVLQDKMVVVDGMQLIGVDYHNASDKEKFQAILSGLSIDRSKPSILLKHEPSDIDVAHAAGISFQMSGHTHRAQQWPLQYMATMIYKRFVYGLQRMNEMQVFTSSGVGTWGPPIRVGTNSEIVVVNFRKE